MPPRPTNAAARLPSRRILGMRVDATSYHGATDRVLQWARSGESRYVCIATVHMVMEGFDNPEYQRIVNDADMVTSDGVPLVWGLKLLGASEATRVYGPQLTPEVCARAADEGVPVGFIGGTEEVLNVLRANLQSRFPQLRIAYSWSPPFRPLTPEEEREAVRRIKLSGARIMFVGLGCPKQERWMHRYRDLIPMPMLGVGAAFDFLAGKKSQAPRFMQRLGLEWLFRLATEPRRLWHRYLYHNPRFVWHFFEQVIRERLLGQKQLA